MLFRVVFRLKEGELYREVLKSAMPSGLFPIHFFRSTPEITQLTISVTTSPHFNNYFLNNKGN
jgi:hypothetical protein